MPTNHHLYDHEDEDYIEMDISSGSDRFVQVMSYTNPLEFEFQMLSSSLKTDTTTSPADELFFKGKLLPLHLSPRFKMVKKMLQNSQSHNADTTYDQVFSTPLANKTSANNTPSVSCNITPSESCQILRRELNPQEYIIKYSPEMSGFIHGKTKKSWIKKLKLIKQVSLVSKLKISRAYFKSLFVKQSCSDESSNVNVDNHIKHPLRNILAKDYQMHQTFKSFDSEASLDSGASSQHRRSFSGVIKWFSASRCSASSSEFMKSSSTRSSYKCPKLKSLNRSSTNPDIENSIQGAIALCKRSPQQQLHSRKCASDMGFFSLSASRIVNEDQEREEVCRG